MSLRALLYPDPYPHYQGVRSVLSGRLHDCQRSLRLCYRKSPHCKGLSPNAETLELALFLASKLSNFGYRCAAGIEPVQLASPLPLRPAHMAEVPGLEPG